MISVKNTIIINNNIKNYNIFLMNNNKLEKYHS